MGRMMTGGVKGIGALLVVWLTYIDKTFSPLFWVLLALVFLDLILNICDEGKQFQKLGSAFVAMGIPTFIANNLGQNADMGKYLVAMMCLVYLQHVVPQLYALVAKLKFSSDPKTNALDQQKVDQLLQLLADKATTEAQKVVSSTQQAGTPGTAADKAGS